MNSLRRTELYAATRTNSRSIGLCLALSFIFGGAMLPAQSSTDGALAGAIEDQAHHPIAFAAVSVKEVDTGDHRTISASRDGTFLLTHLAPGAYSVTITTPSGAATSAEPLQIPLGETTEIRATLRAAAATIQTRAEDLTSATPPLPDENDDGLLSFNGLATTQNRTVLDGASATQAYSSVPLGSGSDPAPDPDSDSDSAELATGPANGLARGRHAGAAYIFAQSSIREFRFGGNNYSAQNGSAAVATTVSRSGSETPHGSIGFILRTQAFAASNPLSIATTYNNGNISTSPVKPHDLRENFAGTLSGAIDRKKTLLFFYTFDAQRRGFPAISSPANPNFYNLSATQLALLANRGVTSSALNTALNYLSSVTGSTPRRADQTLNFLRVDWKRSPRLNAAIQYNAVRWNSPAGLINAPVVARGRASIGNASGSLDSILLRTTTFLTPNISNQAHIGFTRDLQYETPQTPLPQEPAISPGGFAPEVNIGPEGLLFGTPASLSQIAYPDERRIELADTLTVVHHHHLFVLGASLSFVHDQVATATNSAGTFRYDSGVTKGFDGGLVDFLTDYTFNVDKIPNGGCPSIVSATHDFCFRSFSQSFGVSSAAFSTQEWAGFVEDTWRPRTNLTLHLGARYEYTLLPIPVAPNPTLDAIFGTRAATSSFPEDRNNLGPRAAIAWEPLGRGRGTVRTGYGLFFGRLPGATIRAALADTAQPGSVSSIRITPSTVTACPQVPAQGFGYPCSFTSEPTGVAATTTSAVLFDRRFRLPTVQQGSLSLERTIARNTTVSAGYIVNLDRQLPSSTDLNIASSTQQAEYQLQGGTGAPGVQSGEVFYLPLYTARITPSFGPVTDVVSNVNATYNALILAAESRPARNLQLRVNYTWSKAIDFGQSLSATPRTDNQLDPFTNGYDKGLSSLNYPWAFQFTGAWSPDAHPKSRRLQDLVDNWQLAPIFIARAGRPYSFDLSGGTYLAGGHESLNGSGGALYLPTVGRNTLRLPATVNLDLRLARSFRAGSHLHVRTSAEAFNLLNHQNVSTVTQRAYLVGTAVSGVTPLVFQNAAAIATEGLNIQPFGTPTAASSSLARERQVQLSLQLSF